jgi:hypothetical protein
MLGVGMELISPIFVYRDAKWALGIRMVFERLNISVYWKPDRSTGLYVYVALEHRMFALDEITSLAKSFLILKVYISNAPDRIGEIDKLIDWKRLNINFDQQQP